MQLPKFWSLIIIQVCLSIILYTATDVVSNIIIISSTFIIIIEQSWGSITTLQNCTSTQFYVCSSHLKMCAQISSECHIKLRMCIEDSRVVVLFGVHTKKLLFLGVRNKHCSICAVFASVSCITQKQEPPKHQCYKKRNGSSLAIESDIISEGFRLSKSMYTHIVGNDEIILL